MIIIIYKLIFQTWQSKYITMMKKMYEEGDDEMKRTISKAFMESREKSMKGGDMGLGGLDI